MTELSNGHLPGELKSKTVENFVPHDTIISKFTSCRWTTCYMSFLASVLLYTFRHCLSMAFVCMEIIPVDVENRTIHNTTDEFITLTPAFNITNSTEGNISMIEVNTTLQESHVLEKTRINPYVPPQLEGTLLASYFYGYLLTPLIGGTLASKFGPKRLIAISLVIASTATMLIPICIRTNVYLAIAMRIVVGLSSGAINPSINVLWSHWAPINEKAQLAAVTNSGVNIASIMVTVVSSALCEIMLDDGWPFIFYVYGGSGIVWFLFWWLLVYDSPEKHPRIKEREKDVIYYKKTTKRTSVKAPWKKIFKSPPFWALVIAHVSQTWIETTITTFIPMYMNDVLEFKIEENGLLSSLPFIGRFLGGIATAYIADLLQVKAVMKTTYTRKMFQTFGSVIPASLLIGVSYLNADQRILAVALLTLTMTVNSTTIASFRVNHLDIAPRYSGHLMGFTQTCAIVGGIISPSVTAAITLDGTREEWQKVFIITATIVLFANIVFVIFGSGVEQDWAKFKDATIDIPRTKPRTSPSGDIDLIVRNGERPEVPERDTIYKISGDPYSFVYEVTAERKDHTGKVNAGFDSGEDSGINISEQDTESTSHSSITVTRM